MRGETGEAGIGDVVGARPIRYRVKVNLHDCGEIFAAMTEHHGLRYVRTCS
jgi:hypothetical protein